MVALASEGKSFRGPGARGTGPWGSILQGTADAYARKGYAGITVEDIIRAAGVSRRTFYKTFRNKDDALEALFDLSTTVFLQTIREAAERGETPREKMAGCVDAFLEFPTSAGPIHRIFFVEAHEPGSPLAARRQAILGALVDLLDRQVTTLRGDRVDPFVFRGILAALEAIALDLVSAPRLSPETVARAKASMMRILEATLAHEGERVAPLPLVGEAPAAGRVAEDAAAEEHAAGPEDGGRPREDA